MFNSYHSYGGPERVEVEVKRAPTDKSVKLLREMEAAAEKSVLTSGVERLSAGFMYWDAVHDFTGVRMVIQVMLCEKQKMIEIPISRFEIIEHRSPERMCNLIQSKVHAAITEAVAQSIGEQFFRAAAPKISALIGNLLGPK